MMKGMIFAERYQLNDFIGQGGMSLVYRAVDIRTGHSVAVKILRSEFNRDKEFLERFQREAQAASLMNHHNLVNLLDVGVEGDYRYLVLEYVNGSTLKDIIHQRGRLSYVTAIDITVRILSALQHAHANGIIHRDIKPQNVLIDAEGHVKVSDFGIARMTGGATIAKKDTVVGSVHYSSPEQAAGDVVEATSDLYSTGVVLYEMLTGRVPFTGDTPVAIAMQHLQADPPPITDFAPDTPPAVTAVVMKAMAKDPSQRFQSACEMANALMLAKEGVVTVVPPEPPVASPAGQSASSGQVQETSSHSPISPRGHVRHHPKRKTGFILSLAAALLVIAVLAVGVVFVVRQISSSAIAPYVVGMTVEDGREQAQREGLSWQQTDINHDTLPAGTIISQIPEADTPMQKGDSLLVTVSLGPADSAMPNMGGLAYEDAAERLKSRGFGSIIAVKTVSTSPTGTVLSQTPNAGEHFTVGQTVELTISGGSTMVPELTGRTREEASSLLAESALTEATPTYVETSDPAQVGLVLAQMPTNGTMAVLGAPVTLTIGIESQPYQGEVALSLPSADYDRRVRITLMVDDEEKTEYEGTIAANMDSVMLVPISSTIEGEQTCRIYVDGELFSEETVLLY